MQDRYRVAVSALSVVVVILSGLNIYLLYKAGYLGRAGNQSWKRHFKDVEKELHFLDRQYHDLLPSVASISAFPPDYEIYMQAGVCKARDAKTGQVVFQDRDPTRVIQNAINSLPASGGKILIRRGTYILSGHITDGGKDNVILQGEGWKTVLKLSPNTNQSVIDLRRRTGWVIADLAVDGNKARNVQVPGGVPHDMNQNGIHFDEMTSSKIVRVYVHDTVMHGINLHWRSNDNLVVGCKVEDCGSSGDYGASSGILVFSSSERNRIVGNLLIDNHARGIYVSARSNGTIVYDNTIVGGKTEFAQGIIVMDNSNDVVIARNRIYHPHGNGIDVGNRYGPKYSHIAILDNEIYCAGADGIWLGGGGGDSLVEGNQIFYPKEDGIGAPREANITIRNNLIYQSGGLEIWRG